jgi:hypothetical protein
LRREVNVKEEEPIMVRSASWSHNDSSKQVHSILIRPHKYGVYSNWRKRHILKLVSVNNDTNAKVIQTSEGTIGIRNVNNRKN